MKKLFRNKYVLCLGGIFLASSILFNDSEEQKEKEELKIEQEVKLTNTEKIKEIIESELKDKNNEKKERVISIEEEGETYRIKLRSDTIWLEGSLVQKTKKIMNEIKKENFNKQVFINWSSNTMDEYGNISENEVAIFGFGKEEIELINFENITQENFKNNSKTYFVIPAWKN